MKNENLIKALRYIIFQNFAQSDADIANIIGYDKGNLSSFKRGTKPLPEVVAEKLEQHFGISKDFVLGRSREMLLNAKSENETILQKINIEAATCPFEPVCEMKKSNVFFKDTDYLINEVRLLRKEIKEMRTEVVAVLVKSHMKLMHFYNYAQQHTELSKEFNISMVESLIHDITNIENRLLHN